MRKNYLLLLLSFFIFTFCSDEEPAPSPTAYFSYSPTDLNSPCLVSFQDLSRNADELLWDFNDGQTSKEENPSLFFEKGGSYSVKLIAINDVGRDEFTEQIFINQSTSYKIINKTSFDLYFVRSFFDSDNFLLDEHKHGNLSIYESSEVVATSRNFISIIFKLT